MNYQSNKPYPNPRVENKNKNYAKLLLEDYAGNVSEATAIHLYLFQSLIYNQELKNLSDVMLHIAKVEMYHLSLLGKTIQLLGVKPVYGTISKTNCFIAWNGMNVNYATNLKEILEINIKSEKNAIKNYQYHRSIINDKYIKELITRIIEDEEIHLNIFQSLYQKKFKNYEKL